LPFPQKHLIFNFHASAVTLTTSTSVFSSQQLFIYSLFHDVVNRKVASLFVIRVDKSQWPPTIDIFNFKKITNIYKSYYYLTQGFKICYGHLVRMTEDRKSRQILEARIEGKRERGSPRKVWLDDTRSSWKKGKDNTGS
jgi:hypothetical protein